MENERRKPEMLASGETSSDQEWDGQPPQPCKAQETMGVHACANRQQCFEPCGELGHSLEHARVAPPELAQQVDDALDIEEVTLRLPKVLVEFFREHAKREGLADERVAMRMILTLTVQEAVATAVMEGAGSNPPLPPPSTEEHQ